MSAGERRPYVAPAVRDVGRLRPEQLEQLERHAKEGGACAVEADELLELVAGYRLCLALSALAREFRATPAPASTPGPTVLECMFCKRPREPDSKFCERHRDGVIPDDDRREP